MLKGFQTSVNLQKWDLERQPTLLAVSGGLDSVVMAHLFAAAGLKFGIAHVNFGLRGEDSKKDADFVANLSQVLGVPFYLETPDLIAYRKRNGVSVQMAARDLRYGFLRRVISENGFKRLATAHHRDDNLENFFLYMYRGNSRVAWRGIWADHNDVIRPLLGLSKLELHDYAVANQIEWREDRSNLGNEYLRNKIRHWIMPAIDNFADEFYQISLQVQALEKKKKRVGEALWENYCESDDSGHWIPRNAIFYKDFNEFFIQKLKGWGFSQTQIDQALLANQSGKRFESENFILWLGRDGFKLAPKDIKVPTALAFECVESLWDWGNYRFELKRNTWPLAEKSNSYYFSLALSAKSLVMRSWVSGDRMQVFGAGEKKLSDVFVNHKIESFVKPFVPLISAGKGILCAVDVVRSNLYLLESKELECWQLSWTNY